MDFLIRVIGHHSILANVTGACAPWIARGAGLPERYRGDAFVCEPCGNVVIKDTLFVYYGGADTVCGVATAKLQDVVDYVMAHPV